MCAANFYRCCLCSVLLVVRLQDQRAARVQSARKAIVVRMGSLVHRVCEVSREKQAGMETVERLELLDLSVALEPLDGLEPWDPPETREYLEHEDVLAFRVRNRHFFSSKAQIPFCPSRHVTTSTTK